MKKVTANNVLITGGAGYVGAHTVRHLVDRGFDPQAIVVFDNLERGHREFLPAGVRFHKGDLRCKEDIQRVFQKRVFAGVLHFAAYAYVGESFERPGQYFLNNVQGSINLLEAMVQHGCNRIVFSSTCATYGQAGKTAVTEASPARPINPYGESKRMVETILNWYQRLHGVRSVSLRYFNAAGADYGIGEKHDPETHLIPLLIRSAIDSNHEVAIFGNDYPTADGTCIRDFIHVTDLASAHIKAMEFLETHAGCDIINLGTGAGVSVRRLLNLVEDLTGRKIPVRLAGRRPGDAPVLVAEIKKAMALLNWTPQKDIKAILESAWAWHCKELSTTASPI